MGFRNPITTAIDPVARASAGQAETDAAVALTQIIPGSRLAADAIDGKTITAVTIGGSTISGSLIRATGTGDVTATSTGQAFQAGPTAGLNVAIDGNEIGARNNGAWSSLFLNFPIINNPQQPEGSAPTRRDYIDSGGTRHAALTGTAAFAVATGWTLSNAYLREYGMGWGYLNVVVIKATAALTVPASGDIPNTAIGAVPTGWEPADLAPLASSASGRVCHGWLEAGTTSVSIASVGGSGDILVGDSINVGGWYQLNTP